MSINDNRLKSFLQCFIAGFLFINTTLGQKKIIVGQWEIYDKHILPKELIYVNDKETINDIDDDGNGFIDDRYGIFINNDGTVSGNLFTASKDSIDFYDHGTAVVYLMMKGIKNACVTGAGFVPTSMRLKEMKLLDMTVEERLAQLSKEYELLKQYAWQAVQYFKHHKVRIVNLSWGTHFNRMFDVNTNLGRTNEDRKEKVKEWLTVFTNAYKEALVAAPEILFINAAGNNGELITESHDTPAIIDLPNLLVVGALDKKGKIAKWSNYGPHVDVYAIGESVKYIGLFGKKGTGDGASLAAPQVTNIAIQLLETNSKLTATQLKTLLLKKLTHQKYKGKFLVNKNR